MPPEANQNSIGVVLAADGDVFLRSEAGIRQVEAGAEVFRGEELVTGSGSTAEVRFVDDTLLSQGADSAISLDDYVFDDSASDAELLFKMSQGTFRLVTGKIAEQNPDRFQVGTPLATIGIRGTTIVSEISPGGGQKIGVEEIHAGKALLVQSISGEIRMIANARELVDIAMSGQLGSVRPMTAREFDSFREIAPSAIRQEQEIQQQRQEEEQQEQQDDPQDQGQDEQGQDAQGEGDQQGEAEGGETGGPAIPGQGVLGPGVGVILAGELGQGDPFAGGLGGSLFAGAIAEIEDLAGDIFSAIDIGDINTAQNLLNNLQGEIDDVIDELLENIPEEAQGQTVSDGDGNSWILGTIGDDSLKGGDGADSINGLAGNDTIWGQPGNDLIYGEDGNDTIYGECDNDMIYGGAGNDTISGDNGNDTIAGGAGDDTLLGGYGENLIDGGDGTDTLSISDISTSNSTYINMDDSCSCPSGYTGMVSLYIDGVSYESYFANIEAIIGSSGNDYIEGNSGNNYLAGESGNDTLIGEMGDDTLYGGDGKDTLTGGSGADKFLYKSTSECPATVTNADYVTDFVSGTDKFVFSTSGGFTVGGTPFVTSSDYDGATGTGLSANAQFVYDSTDDQLWYDADGSGAGAGVVVANLVGSSDDVASGDIEFIA